MVFDAEVPISKHGKLKEKNNNKFNKKSITSVINALKIFLFNLFFHKLTFQFSNQKAYARPSCQLKLKGPNKK